MKKKQPAKKEKTDAGQGISDWLKKTVVQGIEAVAYIDDQGRQAINDIKIPKKMLSMTITQLDKAKKEVIQRLAGELRDFLDDLKIEDILQKALKGSEVEIKASIRFNSRKEK